MNDLQINEQYRFSEENLETFGFIDQRGIWELANWDRFQNVLGILKSKFYISCYDDEWFVEVEYQEDDEILHKYEFRTLNLVGAFYCIIAFIDERCDCSHFDRIIIENFYLSKLSQMIHKD